LLVRQSFELSSGKSRGPVRRGIKRPGPAAAIVRLAMTTPASWLCSIVCHETVVSRIWPPRGINGAVYGTSESFFGRVFFSLATSGRQLAVSLSSDAVASGSRDCDGFQISKVARSSPRTTATSTRKMLRSGVGYTRAVTMMRVARSRHRQQSRPYIRKSGLGPDNRRGTNVCFAPVSSAIADIAD
jgi:hypothetical protein